MSSLHERAFARASLISIFAGLVGLGACTSANSGGSFTDGGASDAKPTGDAATDDDDDDDDVDAGKKRDAGKTDAKAAQDSATAAKDVAGSAECDAYCAKVKACNSTCIPATDCAIPAGKCAESTRDFLACQADGQWICGQDGFSVLHNCKQDTSLCP